MSSFCSHCGEPVKAGAAFCGECGNPVSPTESRDQNDRDRGSEDQWEESVEHPREDVDRPPRLGAVDTVKESFSWLQTVPLLIGAFVVVELLNAIGEISFIFSLLGLLLGLVVWGATYRYAERFVRGESVRGDFDEIRATAESVTGNLLSLLGIFIIFSVTVFIGLLLLILPGIYLGARLILAFPACVLDDRKAFESLSTSWDVTQGNVAKLVGIFLIWFFAAFGIGVILATLSGGGVLVALLIAAPLVAVLAGTMQLAIGRVYLENRPAPGE